MIDLAAAPDATAQHLVLHRADCRIVRRQAAAGVFVMTMLGCGEVPTGYRRCRCLAEPPGKR